MILFLSLDLQCNFENNEGGREMLLRGTFSYLLIFLKEGLVVLVVGVLVWLINKLTVIRNDHFYKR